MLAIENEGPAIARADSSHSRNPSLSARGRALVRVLSALRQLQQTRRGVTLEELAADGGVTTRTVRRDLEVLQEAGIPLLDVVDDEAMVRERRWFALRAERRIGGVR
jgi:DNA-binding transcriptional ArsR family regulator